MHIFILKKHFSIKFLAVNSMYFFSFFVSLEIGKSVKAALR
jgi:hypothetical protein